MCCTGISIVKLVPSPHAVEANIGMVAVDNRLHKDHAETNTIVLNLIWPFAKAGNVESVERGASDRRGRCHSLDLESYKSRSH